MTELLKADEELCRSESSVLGSSSNPTGCQETRGNVGFEAGSGGGAYSDVEDVWGRESVSGNAAVILRTMQTVLSKVPCIGAACNGFWSSGAHRRTVPSSPPDAIKGKTVGCQATLFTVPDW